LPREPRGHPRERYGVERAPAALEVSPARKEAAGVRGIEWCGILHRGLGHPAQMLDGGDADRCGGERISETEVRRDPEIEALRFARDGAKECRRDAGIHL